MKPEGYRPKEIEHMSEDELRTGIVALEKMLQETQVHSDELASMIGRPDLSKIHPRMAERVKTSTQGTREGAYTARKMNEEAIIAQRARLAEYQKALDKKLAKK